MASYPTPTAPTALTGSQIQGVLPSPIGTPLLPPPPPEPPPEPPPLFSNRRFILMVAVYLFFHGAMRYGLISPSSVRVFEVSWCVVVLKIDLIDYGFASSSFTAVSE